MELNSSELTRLISLTIETVAKLPEVRKTLHVCVAACCDWAAAKLITFLFSPYAVAFWTFMVLLHSFLIIYTIKFIFHETFEGDLRNHIVGRLTNFLGSGKSENDEGGPVARADGSQRRDARAPKGGALKTRQSEKAPKTISQRKGVKDRPQVKAARRPASRGATGETGVEDAAEEPAAARPRRVARRSKG